MTTSSSITGMGVSEVGRGLGVSPLGLTLDAARAAVADAGLTLDDIDGVSSYPGAGVGPMGLSGAGVFEVIGALDLDVTWFSGAHEIAGQLGAIINAVAAVDAGLATHVLCFRTVWEATAQTPERRASIVGSGHERVDGWFQYLVSMGAVSATNWAAMLATRHMHTYGTTVEQLSWIARNARRNAAGNPRALYTDPMTLDDYLASRMISTPLRLYDCDVPCDGGVAFVVSRSDATSGLRRTPLAIDSVGSAIGGQPYWDQRGDLTTMAAHDAARMLWSRSDLTPDDVDVAQLYDGFSILTMLWLEAMGFCGPGESGPFIDGGHRIARDGQLPLNTGGGQLSAGRLHGFGVLLEACIQLWGEGADRQVADDPQVAAVGVGGGPLCGAMLLTRS